MQDNTVIIVTEEDRPAKMFFTKLYRVEIYESGEYCLIDKATDTAITDTDVGINELKRCINFINKNTNDRGKKTKPHKAIPDKL